MPDDDVIVVQLTVRRVTTSQTHSFIHGAYKVLAVHCSLLSLCESSISVAVSLCAQVPAWSSVTTSWHRSCDHVSSHWPQRLLQFCNVTVALGWDVALKLSTVRESERNLYSFRSCICLRTNKC